MLLKLGRVTGLVVSVACLAVPLGACAPTNSADDDDHGGAPDGGHYDDGGAFPDAWIDNGGPYTDFPADPIIDGDAPADSPSLFGDPTSGSETGGPCLVEPELGALIPNNWLRLRVRFIPSDGENLYEIRLHAENQTQDLVVYTSHTTWTMPKPMWDQLHLHTVDKPITVTVRGAHESGGSLSGPPELGAKGEVTIAPAYADGAIVYWTTSNGTALKGFHIGDESVAEVLRPAQANTSCIGCHTSTPGGDFAAYTAAGADPDDETMFVGFKAADGSSTAPSFLSANAKTLFARTWQMAPAFSQAHFSAGDYVGLSMYMNTDIMWTDMESSSSALGTGWGLITRTGDPNYPATANFSHDGKTIAYCSTPNEVISGVQTSGCDIYTVPYNNRAGGAAKPLEGAAEGAYGEYYPGFSPDDQLIAFNRIGAAGDTYANPDAELYVIPATGGTPVRLAANDPPACTGKHSPGLMNSWPKWAPNVTPAAGKQYYWLTFSSTRDGDLYTPQLYITAVVVDELGIKTYPSLYLWNQPADEGNHTPAWDTFNIVVDKK
jgi:hypothetical protein